MSLTIHGQQSMFKALFMFNFAKYIVWPDQAKQNEFIIGVSGNDAIISELNKLAAIRKINGKPIVIKKVKSPSEAPNANMYYIPASNSGKLSEVTTYFAGKPTLIITNKDNLCKKGACINYVNRNGKLKYEVNQANIKSHQLNVDPKLIALGIEIK
ncbi:hypothetical protein JCM21142_104400 [Saccharicrinis fermentans DSM 9555 = JCM 21142]|uniref:YfiR family protein n=2 Tax=Saccharicrinis fermentans TaxID=982 RepID=W7Y462_9BACT|nr:hypothetical protein JCM21142_104400 [Saccharicrinis fermentans DSM 9555 = JCM 21142]